jgi:hypothetical protein
MKNIHGGKRRALVDFSPEEVLRVEMGKRIPARDPKKITKMAEMRSPRLPLNSFPA